MVYHVDSGPNYIKSGQEPYTTWLQIGTFTQCLYVYRHLLDQTLNHTGQRKLGFPENWLCPPAMLFKMKAQANADCIDAPFHRLQTAGS